VTVIFHNKKCDRCDRKADIRINNDRFLCAEHAFEETMPKAKQR
jgi:arsenate reductase-like glutaredoxin family protein